MTRLFVVCGLLLGLGGVNSATAGDAPFGCTARAPNVCHFHIFYMVRGDRVVILTAGTKTKVPGVKVGRDQYCVALGKTPPFKCERKAVNAQLNS